MSSLGLMCDIRDMEWQRYINGVTLNPYMDAVYRTAGDHN